MAQTTACFTFALFWVGLPLCTDSLILLVIFRRYSSGSSLPSFFAITSFSLDPRTFFLRRIRLSRRIKTQACVSSLPSPLPH